MEAIKSGNNRSFDQDTPSSSGIVTSPSVVASTAAMDPSKQRNRNRRVEKVVEEVSTPVVVEKARDISEYHVPKDMGVAVNQEALDEVVAELGSDQPTFLKRMIKELKGK